jgi:hypothetical protein
MALALVYLRTDKQPKRFHMKKILVAALFLVFSFQGMAQQLEPTLPPAPQVDYLKKSRKQQTAGLILFSAGTVGVLATFMIELSNEESYPDLFWGSISETKGNYTVPYVLSCSAMAGSMLLFKAAAKNKRAARANVYMKMSKVPTLQSGSLKSNAYPTMA